MSSLLLVFNGTEYILGGIRHEKVYGLVVFLDALGLKGIWKTRDPEEVLNNWNSVYYLISNSVSRHLNGPKLSAFSDTFIISLRGHREILKTPWRFVEILSEAIIPPLLESMKYEFFFRGVMVFGAFSRSTRMLIGPAVDEAAQYYETANWIGLSLSPSTRWILNNSRNESDYLRNPELIVSYKIPQKPPWGLTWSLNWIPYDRYQDSWNILCEKAILHSRKKEYDRYSKYANTLRYYTGCIRL